MKRNIVNGTLCLFGFDALRLISKSNSKKYSTKWLQNYTCFFKIGDNQITIKKAGGIETILEIMRRHIGNDRICGYGCGTLKNILEANCTTQSYACEKECVELLLYILRIYADHKYICEAGVETLGIILSSQRTHSMFYTEEIVNTVQSIRKRHESSIKILQGLIGLVREEDQRVLEAVRRGSCTKTALPKCRGDCKYDENGYCSNCCIQQRVYKCITCDKSRVKLYCEACWKKNHQGHQCEEFFYPTKCGTCDQ